MKLLLLLTAGAVFLQIVSSRSVQEAHSAILPVEPDAGQGRIIEGNEAERGQFPYMAAIYIDRVTFCGGTLVTPRYVLTTAFCILSYREWYVFLGAIANTPGEDGIYAIISTVATRHEGFDWLTYADNIGVVDLRRNVTYNDYVQPILFPTRSQVDESFEGELGIVSGWGSTVTGRNEVSETLLYTQQLVVPNENCSIYTDLLTDDTLCATDPNLGHWDTLPCDYDNGGPLALPNEDGSYTQIGIVSLPPCINNISGLYVRVTSYLDWISARTGAVILD